jgi:transcription elongation factor Elf1
MGRRRRKVLRVNRRTLPKVFSCPHCGMVAIRITSHQDETSQDYVTVVACGNENCRVNGKPLMREFRYPTERQAIDIYNTFVDDFAKAGA